MTPKQSIPDPQRAAIADHLAAHGPTQGDALAVAVGLTPERFWALINHPWFDICGRGWDLTDAGRRRDE
jgi:hypothetical protein